MKPIVFDTVIDGRLYQFRGHQWDWGWTYEAYLNDRYVDDVRGKNEESVILHLVKLLEK